jgi:hypothetical protein
MYDEGGVCVGAPEVFELTWGKAGFGFASVLSFWHQSMNTIRLENVRLMSSSQRFSETPMTKASYVRVYAVESIPRLRSVAFTCLTRVSSLHVPA